MWVQAYSKMQMGREKYKMYHLERKKSTRKHNVVAKACAVREAVVVKGIAP